MTPTLRGKTYHLRKRVPLRFAAIEPRKVVWISLHTDSEKVAKAKAPAAWSEMLEAWEAMLAGQTDQADAYFEAARQLAQARGFRYLPAERVAKLPVENILERVEAIRGVGGKPSAFEASALLGGAAEPAITVTRALEAYWTLAKDKTFGKSEDQPRRINHRI